jgi:flavin-binding protein dodecin
VSGAGAPDGVDADQRAQLEDRTHDLGRRPDGVRLVAPDGRHADEVQQQVEPPVLPPVLDARGTPLADPHEAGLLQALERLAHRVAVDAVALGQRALGRDRVAGRQVAREDLGAQAVVQHVGDAAGGSRPPPTDHRVRHHGGSSSGRAVVVTGARRPACLVGSAPGVDARRPVARRDVPTDSRGPRLSDNVYRTIKVTGSSTESVADAIRKGVAATSKSVDNVEWFAVTEIRGHVTDGTVEHFQVTMDIGHQATEQ